MLPYLFLHFLSSALAHAEGTLVFNSFEGQRYSQNCRLLTFWRSISWLAPMGAVEGLSIAGPSEVHTATVPL